MEVNCRCIVEMEYNSSCPQVIREEGNLKSLPTSDWRQREHEKVEYCLPVTGDNTNIKGGIACQ